MGKISVDHLYFSYCKSTILKDINFSVPTGNICALLGPNGSGKTTLLKSIMGLREPSSGNISIDGVSLKSMTAQKIASIVSMVPQQSNVVFPYTVLDMVLLGKCPFLGWTGVPNNNDVLEAQKLLKQLDIYYLHNRSFNELSGGEKQIVIFARALFQNTDIMLLDEPTSNLDFKNQFYLLDLVKEISAQRSLTVIITLHDPNLAAHYCGKVIMLKHGELLYNGNTTEGFIKENLMKLYNMKIQVRNLENHRQIILPMDW